MKLVIPSYSLFIDPGINIGIAGFSNTNNVPIYTNLINCTRLDRWEDRIKFVLITFDLECKKLSKQYKKVYIEQPQFFDSYQGRAAAKSESLYKLIKVYGVIWTLLFQNNFEINEILASAWKGQLDKKKLQHRVQRRINIAYPDHICDAVGLGLFVKGIF